MCVKFCFLNVAQIQLQKSKILHTGVTIGKEYMVRFKVLATKFVGTMWTSVLHFTTGGDYQTHGSRIPAIFFR